MEKRTEVNTRADGSTFTTEWTKTEWFCVGCGKKDVWEDDCDDYYLGTEFKCFSCTSTFNCPGGP